MGAACSNSNKVVQATVRKTGRRLNKDSEDSDGNKDGVINDPSGYGYGYENVERMHEKLWKAVESNDRSAAEKFLELNDI